LNLKLRDNLYKKILKDNVLTEKRRNDEKSIYKYNIFIIT